MFVITPPHNLREVRTRFIIFPSIFLGGSIEMGSAVDWQKEVTDSCSHLGALFLNPRRPDWNSSWKQSISNPNFKEQVEWEINGLDICDCIFLYFEPSTKAPISLMEFGLHVKTNKHMIVVCPDGYWRKGNIEIVMNMFRPQQKILNSLNEGVDALCNYINRFDGA